LKIIVTFFKKNKQEENWILFAPDNSMDKQLNFITVECVFSTTELNFASTKLDFAYV